MGCRYLPPHAREALSGATARRKSSSGGPFRDNLLSVPARRVLVPLVPLLVVAAFACDERAIFTTKVASDLASTKHTASVLGVFRDGRMSMGGWDVVAPYLEPVLGSGSSHCDVGYDALVSSNTSLASAIDEYARADGPTDDLLAQIAPAAQGDLVLVLTFAGKLPEPREAGVADAAFIRTDKTHSGVGRGGAGSFGVHESETPADLNQLEISASLYSVALGRSVALVGMQYTGTDIDDALSRFAAKLRQSLPALKCAGWNWNASIDPERIRAKMHE
jgi:hypothetical protein